MNINELVELAHQNAVNKGFWASERNFGAALALIHSEVSEALEDFRNGYAPDQVYYEDEKPCGIPIEFADIIIRIFDLCGYYGIDLEKMIDMKMKYNLSRPQKHGKKI